MSVSTRVGKLERDHFTEACRQFRSWFLRSLHDPDADRWERAALVPLGAPADGTWAEIHAWFAAQPTTPAGRALGEAIDAILDLLLERPDDHAAIRAALANLAPHMGLAAHDPPLAILAALRATFAGTDERAA